MNKKLLLISGLVFILIIVAVGALFGYRYLKNRKSPEQATAPTLQSAASTTDTILQNAAQGVLPAIGAAANPLTNMPDINPASKANPFDSVKTNPFR